MKTAIPTHAFAPDGLPSHRGGPEGCQHCPLPKAHPVHRLPAVDADITKAEARRIGEGNSA